MYPLSYVLARARTLYSARPAVIDGEKRFTYGDLAGRVERLAAGLLGLGLKSGDRVAILDHNSHRYLEAYYACAHAGLVYMPLNTRLAPKEIDYILNDSDARALLFSQPFAEMYEVAQESARSLEFGVGMDVAPAPPGVADYEALIADADPMPEPVPSGPDDVMLIYYTSGTTGEPKGVCLTNQNMFAGGLDPVMCMSLTRDDVMLHTAPLFHLAGSWAVWAIPMVGGVQVAHQFEPQKAIELIAGTQATIASLPGAIIGMMANLLKTSGADVSSLRRIVYGGSPTPAGVLRLAAEVFPPALNHTYGITETAGYVTQLLPEDHVFDGGDAAMARTVSAGQATPLIEVAIKDDDGNFLPPGEVGEIVCAGPKIMQGYWRKPEQTADVLRDGWYHTGDIGRLDGDSYLTVVDRKKDMIISGGENVYSVEVESVLSTHPGVMEVAVIGLPDEKWGEAVTGVIVPRAGAEVSPEELIAHCRGQIGGYKIPRRFEFRAEPLPKTGPGKIAKRRLRDDYS